MTYRDWLADDVRRLWSEERLGASHSLGVLQRGNAGTVFSGWEGKIMKVERSGTRFRGKIGGKWEERDEMERGRKGNGWMG